MIPYGKGIGSADTQNPKSLGIVGMKERALFLGGDLSVRGSGESGTIVTLEVPLNGTDNETS